MSKRLAKRALEDEVRPNEVEDTEVFELRKTEAKLRALINRMEMTPEEDAAITADALADPDNPPADDLIRRRGRPPLEHPKEAIKLRLDADVLDHFRSTGPGWQTRINDALRKVAGK